MADPMISTVSFDRPPVIETRIGVQFAPLIGFRSGHFGLFWEECVGTKDWRILADQPASPKEIERFGSKKLRPTVEKDEGDFPQICMRLSSKDGRTVQFQPNKLIYGWYRTEGRPSFDEVRGQFDKLFADLERYVVKWDLGILTPNLWEVTYVNKILPGKLWQTPSDWHKVLPGIFPPGGPTVGDMDWSTFNGTWFFVIPPERGRVRMRVQKVVANQTDEILLLLVITARGEIGEPGVADWSTGLNLGHQSAARVFHDVASPKAREEWGVR
jgi:uncharacterized protein (TIGR04255 family)